MCCLSFRNNTRKIFQCSSNTIKIISQKMANICSLPRMVVHGTAVRTHLPLHCELYFGLFCVNQTGFDFVTSACVPFLYTTSVNPSCCGDALAVVRHSRSISPMMEEGPEIPGQILRHKLFLKAESVLQTVCLSKN